MAFTPEDGSGVTGANALAPVAAVSSYHLDRGNAAWGLATLANQQAAIVRATSFIAGQYAGRWSGVRTYDREQTLPWPRYGAYDAEDIEIPDDEIPREIIAAVAEAALRELTSPGSLQPDLKRGGAIERVKAGSVEVQYSAGASSRTTFTIIDDLLSPLLTGETSGGGLFGVAVRG